MSYQLKRINPFWLSHPMVPTAVAIGAICALIGYQTQKLPISIVGGAIAGLAILAAARPVFSTLFAAMGLLGGAIKFFLVPSLDMAGMSLKLRLVSLAVFLIFYTVLMDALILVVSVLYNFFAHALGFGGLRLELESDEEPSANP